VKAGLALLLLGFFGLIVQSSAALWIPARFLPDTSLLVVVALAVCLRSPFLGVVLAALLGYATDLLSGALLGQHAVLCLGAYGTTRVVAARLNLRGWFSLALFAFVLSLAHAAALHGLVAFFADGLGVSLGSLREWLSHALVNALAAPLAVAVVSGLASWLGDDDSGRPLRLEPRTLSL
jgi:cell shape-determining protein MreD